MRGKINIAHDLVVLEPSELSKAYFALDLLIKSENESIASVSQLIIEQYPDLERRLIDLINLGLYDLSEHVTELAQAVRLIGHGQVRDLVLALTLADALIKHTPEIVTNESFWKHSVACGVACGLIAKSIDQEKIARYFTVGLLHDVGSLFVYHQISEKSLMSILRARHSEKYLFELEQEILGYHHAHIGGMLIQNLNLPLWLQEAIAYHHEPLDAPNFCLSTVAVHVADIVVNAMRYGSRGEFLVPNPAEGVWEKLGISAIDLHDMIEGVDIITPKAMKAVITNTSFAN